MEARVVIFTANEDGHRGARRLALAFSDRCAFQNLSGLLKSQRAFLPVTLAVFPPPGRNFSIIFEHSKEPFLSRRFPKCKSSISTPCLWPEVARALSRTAVVVFTPRPRPLPLWVGFSLACRAFVFGYNGGVVVPSRRRALGWGTSVSSLCPSEERITRARHPLRLFSARPIFLSPCVDGLAERCDRKARAIRVRMTRLSSF